MRDLTRLGMPVPAGFTVGDLACRRFLGSGELPAQAWDEIVAASRRMAEEAADAGRPLLMAVRSSPPVPMPGVLAHSLHVGMTAQRQEELASWASPEFAVASRIGFLQGWRTSGGCHPICSTPSPVTPLPTEKLIVDGIAAGGAHRCAGSAPGGDRGGVRLVGLDGGQAMETPPGDRRRRRDGGGRPSHGVRVRRGALGERGRLQPSPRLGPPRAGGAASPPEPKPHPGTGARPLRHRCRQTSRRRRAACTTSSPGSTGSSATSPGSTSSWSGGTCG